MENKNEKNNQMFNEHLSNVTFKYGEYEFKFNQVYEFLKNNTFPIDDFNIDISYDNKIYTLFHINDKRIVFYFFDHLFNLELCDRKSGKSEIQKICSTYEIFEIMKEKNTDFYYDSTKLNGYCITPLMISNDTISLDYYTEKIHKINFEDKYIYKYLKDKNFNPNTFAKNFYSYFPELKYGQNIDIKLQYIKTKKRDDLEIFITQYLIFNKIIKLTGPSGTGKSFFLLYLSRTKNIYLYLNLAVLNSLIKQSKIIQAINMIIIELNRLKLTDIIKDEMNKYFEEIDIIDLDTMVKYLINYFIKNKCSIIIIMDQFKDKYFKSWDDFEDKFNKSESNINLIICSSINNHNIRDSVLRNINDYVENETRKNDGDDKSKTILKSIKSEYFYISNLFDKESLKQLYSSNEGIKIKPENHIIYESFDYNPKYVFKINKADSIDLKIKEIINKIKQKFKDFYNLNDNNMSLELKLSSLRRYIGHLFPIEDFNKIIPNFSLKYFIIKFYTKEGEINFMKKGIPIQKFQIDYSFSMISEIIEEMALESNDLFFDNGIYKVHTDSTIESYFKLIAIDKIKKKLLTLPNNNYEYIINVDKINEMNVIKLRVSDLINDNMQKLLNEIWQKKYNLLKNKNFLSEGDDNKINLEKIKEDKNNLLNNDINIQNEKKNDNNKMVQAENTLFFWFK